ncbi:MAG: FAD-binding oxidoreductase [Armatimonadetes bacterium]|nr:FAD-binding oxidoreductase [Armatimonadota bacterium]
MKATADTLVVRFESALGKEAVQSDLHVMRSYAVDGVVPSVKVMPTDAAQIGMVLKICTETGVAVIPWGGGTSMSLGNVPSRAEVVLGLERLGALIEHDDANLTATVESGMRVAALQQVLARRQQFLALDPPRPADATTGGVVAANTNGPRRMLYGGVRDQVIGMKVVLATGEQVKAGGKVVKNVAGYDMCKLFTGSLGTLGVITEVTFRMAPVPERTATVLASGTLAQALEMTERTRDSVLLPAAIAVLNAHAASTLTGGPDRHNAILGIWIEGFTEAVGRHLKDLRAMANDVGMSADVLEGTAHDALWERVRDFGSGTSGALFRLTVPLGAVGEAVASISGWSPVPQIVAHAGAGTIWILTDSEDAPAWLARLAALAATSRGHTIIAAAPPHVKGGLDVWGPPPPGLSIMQEVKRQFDPAGILNPGRFVAGL